MSFSDLVWFLFLGITFLSYLTLFVWAVYEVLTDREASGWSKSIWILLLIVVPLLGSSTYLIFRMARNRRTLDAIASQEALRDPSPEAQIAHARSLLEAGIITHEEFSEMQSRTSPDIAAQSP